METAIFTRRVINAFICADSVRADQGKFLRAFKRLKALEAIKYTDHDLRGLSAREKSFMRDNSYNTYYDCCGKRYYLFISRNRTTGKKQLYAYEKKQYLRPNRHDIIKSNYYHNYQCWLTVNTDPDYTGPRINKYCFEFRMNILPTFWLLT